MVLDILALIVLFISAGIAFMRGFIREVLTIAGVLGGLAAAYFAGPLLIPSMEGWLGVTQGEEVERLFGVLPYDLLAIGLSYGLIFVVVVILLSVMSHFLAEGAKSIGLGAVDRTFGFIFGVVRGVVVLALLYLPVHIFFGDEAKEKWFGESKTHFYIEKTSAAMSGLITREQREKGQGLLDRANAVNETREALKDSPLLQSPDTTSTGEANGYSEEFRNEMDALFQEESHPSYNE
ncbi:MAG: CvpA family protein [Alphaproteobacteria bacterium]